MTALPDGARVPPADPADPDLQIAARYAPRILFDEAEPFLPVVTGYTVFRAAGPSPSFPRQVDQALKPAWSLAVEYAIWFDWDIQHLYELEHAWSYVDASGRLVWAEASWHGDYASLLLANGEIARMGDRPLMYAQPGKHAFVPEEVCLRRVQHFVLTDPSRDAGDGGVLVKDMYAGQICPTPEDHQRAARYLRARAFTPTLQFNRPFTLPAAELIPWPVLDRWIPARVAWWLAALQADPNC
jgi:putative hydrolase of the HAD superfamily